MPSRLSRNESLIEQLRELLQAEHFQPFVIRVAGGRSLRVRHRDFLFITVNQRLIFEEADGAAVVINPALVSQIEVPASPRRRRIAARDSSRKG